MTKINTLDETRKEMVKLLESLNQNINRLSTVIRKVTKKKRAKPKKIVDKNKPKQALSSFMYFYLANRERVKNNQPKIKATEISAIIGKEWKTLDDNKRSLWDDYARKDRDRYKKEIQIYNNELMNQLKEKAQESKDQNQILDKMDDNSNKKDGNSNNYDNNKDSYDSLISESNDKQAKELKMYKSLIQLKEQNQNNRNPAVKSNSIKKKKITFNDTRDFPFKTIGSTSSRNMPRISKHRLRKNKIQRFTVTERK